MLPNHLNCAFLGPKGTFSEIAAISYFGNDNNFYPQKTITEVFEVIENNKNFYGIVPIENSIEGSVSTAMDLLFEISDVVIVGECIVPIRHFLLSNETLSLEKVKVLYSHQQAINQCNKFIKKNLKSVEIIFTASTTNACEIISNIPNAAAIASKRAIQLYNLKVLASDIQDSNNNYTRFLVIKNKNNEVTFVEDVENEISRYKTSIICAPKYNKAGVLCDILEIFKRENINLTRIESRPTKKQLGEYLFYIDLEGYIHNPKIEGALNNIKNMCSFFKFLGSYPLKREMNSTGEVIKN